MGIITDFIDNAIDGYKATALWSESDDQGDPLDEHSDPEDFTLPASLGIATDVMDFVDANWDDVRDLNPGDVGHDFWLTRNGHGTGFWDRGYGDLGDRLSAAAKVYGSSHLWRDDNGNIHVEG